MKKKLKSFLAENRYSPIATGLFFGAAFFVIAPSISLVLLNSRSLMLASFLVGFFFIPWSLSFIHKINFFKIAGIWCFFISVSFLTMPKNWEGNIKLAIVDHFLPGMVLSLIGSVLMIMFF
jgi:hypothetical protein